MWPRTYRPKCSSGWGKSCEQAQRFYKVETGAYRLGRQSWIPKSEGRGNAVCQAAYQSEASKVGKKADRSR